ncbi:DnaA regulatory inactivator Hda [Pseudoteredinibacter isoporae]|uniref:DnaA family protein n=1 Tax=Pseudoteredinibacter isoporae TaxID=570281 RepID=A0A7X0MWG9_9GAMM|nr:DnaA family protein [Pseudoteredinibacter isoporae]NHO87700.1 DnaA regulatory inactivator Hda [Pseudoteredinibacter isoporae]NIB23969.1 DnaA regulatory inactivator Hda [Pseudoteredinibacter isoporae]
MEHSQPQQLSLGVALADDATFENFYTQEGSAAAQAVHALQHFMQSPTEHGFFLWGASGSGLSHLLQASCHLANQQQLSAQYLPLSELVGFAPDALLEGMDGFDLLCLDGLQHIAGKADWEQALFNCFNRSKDSGRKILFSANANPTELNINLPDLASRLSWGLSFQVPLMGDAEKQQALTLRAKARGLELSDEVAQFILHRAPRHIAELFEILDRLDNASLAEQRKLTIPFVKQVLGL